MLLMALAWSFAGSIEIRYVLLVLWMMSQWFYGASCISSDSIRQV